MRFLFNFISFHSFSCLKFMSNVIWKCHDPDTYWIRIHEERHMHETYAHPHIPTHIHAYTHVCHHLLSLIDWNCSRHMIFLTSQKIMLMLRTSYININPCNFFYLSILKKVIIFKAYFLSKSLHSYPGYLTVHPTI